MNHASTTSTCAPIPISFPRPEKLRCSVYPVLLGICLLLAWDSSYGQTSADPAWQVLESRHTRIRYRSLDDLRKFDRSVDYAPGAWGLKGLFGFTGSENLPADLPKKMDALFERVQQILDMRKRMKRVSIHVHGNKAQLHAAFRERFNAPCPVRAWYAHEQNTIHLNAKDVHEGIVAHEMAHAIIDHYLLVRPPRATAEILARYVDAHLFE